MYRYFTYFILLGSILTLCFYSMQDALSVMYISEIEQYNFGLFFFVMSLIVIVIGMVFQWFIPLKTVLIKLDVYGPVTVMIVAVIVGNVYGHSIKNDEFLFYFILTHLVTMYAALATGRQIVSLIKRGTMSINEIPQTIVGIIVGSAVVYFIHFYVTDFMLIAGIWNIYLALVLSKLAIDWYKKLYDLQPATRSI